MQKIEKCQKCGTDDADGVVYKSKTYWVECYRCGDRGLKFITEKESIKFWNQYQDYLKEKDEEK